MSTSYSVTVTGRVYEQPDNQPNSMLGSGTISLTANVTLSVTSGKIAGFNQSGTAAFTSGIANSSPEEWRVVNAYQYSKVSVAESSQLSYLLLIEATANPSSFGLNAITGYVAFIDNSYIYTAKIDSAF